MSLLIEAETATSDKLITKYIKAQFKLMKKSKESINTNDICCKIADCLGATYEICILQEGTFSVKLLNCTCDIIKTNIQNIINRYYGNIDVNLLFKFSTIDNTLLIKKKRNV